MDILNNTILSTWDKVANSVLENSKVLLHLWDWDGSEAPMDIFAHSWAVYHKREDLNFDEDESYTTPPLWARRTKHHFQLQPKAGAPPDIDVVDIKNEVRELVLDHDVFQAQFSKAAAIHIPLVSSDRTVILAAGYQRGLTIPGGISIWDSSPANLTLNWKGDGPADWKPLVIWADEMIVLLDQAISRIS